MTKWGKEMLTIRLQTFCCIVKNPTTVASITDLDDFIFAEMSSLLSHATKKEPSALPESDADWERVVSLLHDDSNRLRFEQLAEGCVVQGAFSQDKTLSDKLTFLMDVLLLEEGFNSPSFLKNVCDHARMLGIYAAYTEGDNLIAAAAEFAKALSGLPEKKALITAARAYLVVSAAKEESSEDEAPEEYNGRQSTHSVYGGQHSRPPPGFC